MLRLVRILLPVLFTVSLLTAIGQPPRNSKPNHQVAQQKPKLPKLITSLGTHSDSVAAVTVDEALQIIGLPLKITDDKKNSYNTASYQFLYRRIEVTENEETGKVSPTSSMVSSLFKETPLPDIWKNNISGQLKHGEELYFFDVVAKDATGRLMFAPNLKLIIK